jgi:hypothetical protein
MAATLVQGSGLLGANQSTPVSSITFNAASAFTVGNDVIVSIAMQANNLISSVTIAGTTATKDSSRETDTFRAVYIFRARVVNSGQTAVTVNLPAADTFSISLSIDEWSGFATTPLDTTGNAAPTGTTLCSVNATDFTTQADELVYATVIFSSDPGTTTFPSGYTTSFDDIANTYYWSAAAYQTVSSITLANALWTATNSINSRLALATYKIATAPVIDAQPVDVVAPYGTTATFTVSATSNIGAMTYQWEESVNSGSTWDKAPGTYTNSTYNRTSVTFTENGNLYRVQVTNSVGTTTSSSALLTVPSPGITVQPANQSISTGSTATFSVTAVTTSAPLAYQWYRQQTPGSGFSTLSGATSSSYTTGTLTTADSGWQYLVLVTDAGSGAVYSNAATVTVNPIAPSITLPVFDIAVFDPVVFDTANRLEATVAFTLDSVTVAASGTVTAGGKTATMAFTLDDVAVASSATLGHPATLAVTLDGITFAASASIGGSLTATMAVTLDGITVASSATLGHPATLAATLDGVTVASSATLGHPATLAATLDTIAVNASATVSSPGAITGTMAFTLDGIAFAADAIVVAAPVVSARRPRRHGVKFEPYRPEKDLPTLVQLQQEDELVTDLLVALTTKGFFDGYR